MKHVDWFEPELNPKVQSFAEHYGTVFLPTRPYMPRHKGKVERGIDYVKENALKGRAFASLDEQNRFLLDWEMSVADTRIHGTTRRQVGKLFAEVEKAALRQLPVGRFPFFDEGRRSVHRDGHIEVARSYYSVPPEYLGSQVWVRWDARLVRIFNRRWEQIAVHVKHEPGRFSTQGEHIAAAKISGVERGKAWILGQIHGIGTHAVAWSEAVMRSPWHRGCSRAPGTSGPDQEAPRRRHRAGVRHRHNPRLLPSAHGAHAHRPAGALPGTLRLHGSASVDSSVVCVPGPVIHCKGGLFVNDSLRNALKQLRLSGLLSTLDVRLQEAAGHGLNHAEFLELLLQDELAVRSDRLLKRRIKAAAFRELKTLDDFDWAFNPSIKKKQVFDLATGRFVREARDVLLIGPPGVGKSHLVQAIAYHALKAGFVVLYRSIFDVVRDFLHDEAVGVEHKILTQVPQTGPAHHR